MARENVSSKVKIKEMLDNSIYWSYNRLSNLSLLCSKYRNIVKNNARFKNLHQGERCFILGTGPSLKRVNTEMLKDEVLFGVNYLYLSDIVDSISLNYYCLYDEKYHGSRKKDTLEAMNKLPNTIFFLRTNAFDAMNSSNVNTDNIFYQNCNLFQYNDLIECDMTRNMTGPFNVVIACLQIAIYMGFKDIYLLGCDFNSFANLKVEHCYGNPGDRIITMGYELKYFSMICYHHYAIEKYARKNNIRIYNATPNSLLDAYRRETLTGLHF